MAIPTVEATQITNVISNASTTGAITLTLGTISPGDIIFVFCAIDGTAAAPTGSGNNSGAMTVVSVVGNPDEGTVETECLYAMQGATVDTTITVNWTGSEQGRFMYVRVAGGHPSAPIDVIGTNLTGTGTTATPVSSASTAIDTLFMSCVAVDRDVVNAADTVSGTGWVEVGTSGISGGANGAGLIVAELDQASVGTPANAVFGTWTSDGYAAYTFNILPPPPPIVKVATLATVGLNEAPNLGLRKNQNQTLGLFELRLKAPVCYYPMDSSNVDYMGNAENLVWNGAETWDTTNKKIGTASADIETTRNPDIPHSSAIDIFDRLLPFSISWWQRLHNNTSARHVISKGGVTNGMRLWNAGVLNRITTEMTGDGGEPNDEITRTYENPNYQDDVWQHIVWTYSGNGAQSGINLYIDGKLTPLAFEGSDSLTTTIANTNDLNIGSTLSHSNRIDGELDDFMVFDYELSANQVGVLFDNTNGLHISTPQKQLTHIKNQNQTLGLFEYRLKLPILHARFDNNLNEETGSDTLSMLRGSENYDATNKKLGTHAFNFTDTQTVQADTETKYEFGQNTPFSVSCWIRVAAVIPSVSEYIWAKKLGTANVKGWLMYFWAGGTGKLSFLGNDGTSNIVGFGSASILQDNVWFHCVVTFSGNGNENGFQMYINGKVDSEAIGSVDISSSDFLNNDKFTIGGSTNAGGEVNGQIDDFMVFDYELSQVDVETLFERKEGSDINNVQKRLKSIRNLADTLKLHEHRLPIPISYFKFDDTPNDEMNNANGTWTGTPTYTTSQIGKSATFDGTTQYITLANEDKFDFERTDPFSVSMWVKNTASTTSALVFKGSIYSSAGWQIRQRDTDFLITIFDSGLNQIFLGSGFDVSDNLWHHLVCTYSGNSNADGLKCYSDGVLTATGITSTSLALSILTNEAVVIGARGDGNAKYTGDIDEVAIWDIELTADQVAVLYESPAGLQLNSPQKQLGILQNITTSIVGLISAVNLGLRKTKDEIVELNEASEKIITGLSVIIKVATTAIVGLVEASNLGLRKTLSDILGLTESKNLGIRKVVSAITGLVSAVNLGLRKTAPLDTVELNETPNYVRGLAAIFANEIVGLISAVNLGLRKTAATSTVGLISAVNLGLRKTVSSIVGINETPNILKVIGAKFANEIVGLISAVNLGLRKTAPLDTVELNEARETLRGLVKVTTTFIVGLISAVNLGLRKTAPLSTVGINETPNRLGGLIRAIPDIVGLTEALSIAYRFTKNEIVQINEASEYVKQIILNIVTDVVELVSPANAQALIGIVKTTTTEIVGLISSVNLGMRKTTSDIVGFVEAKNLGLRKTLGDIVGIDETKNRLMAIGAKIINTILDINVPSEKVNLAHRKNTNEIVGLNETPNILKVIGAKFANEIVGLISSVNLGLRKTLGDIVGIDETKNRLMAIGAKIINTILDINVPSEKVNLAHRKNVDEIVELNETPEHILGLLKVIATDIVGLISSVNLGLRKTLSDIVGVIETPNVIVGLIREIPDIIGLNDILNRLRVMVRTTPTDTVGLVETPNRLKVIAAIFANEIVGIFESPNKLIIIPALVRVISDTIGLTELVNKILRRTNRIITGESFSNNVITGESFINTSIMGESFSNASVSG